MERPCNDRRRGHSGPGRHVSAAVLVAGVLLLASCGDDDGPEGPDTQRPKTSVLADDVTLEAEIDEDVAVLRVTAPPDRKIGVADAHAPLQIVEGDTVSYPRDFRAGERSPDGVEAPTGVVVFVRAGETVELPSTPVLRPDTARVCVEIVDPMRYGDDDTESGETVTVDPDLGDRYACVELDRPGT